MCILNWEYKFAVNTSFSTLDIHTFIYPYWIYYDHPPVHIKNFDIRSGNRRKWKDQLLVEARSTSHFSQGVPFLYFWDLATKGTNLPQMPLHGRRSRKSDQILDFSPDATEVQKHPSEALLQALGENVFQDPGTHSTAQEEVPSFMWDALPDG